MRMSSKFENRVKVMYDRRRRSLNKLEEIKRKQAEELIKDCTFKPVTTNYAFKQNLPTAFERLVIFAW